MVRTKKTTSMPSTSGHRKSMAHRSCMRLVDVKKLLEPPKIRRRTIPRKKILKEKGNLPCHHPCRYRPDVSLSSQLAAILGIISATV